MKLTRPLYHGAVALFAHYWFGKPSEKIIVVGITGTNGKTTSVNLTAKILEEAGYNVGFTSTVTLKAGLQTELNRYKMTMPSGWLLQKWLAEMVKQRFHYAIIEVSSEGLAQNRHLGINFDVAVFTNLTPEHIESHGSFAAYQKAKAKLFNSIHASSLTPAKLEINPLIQKTIITNMDDPYGTFYAHFPAQKYLTYSTERTDVTVHASSIRYSARGIHFKMNGENVELQLKGQFDVANALCAATVGVSQGITVPVCARALEKVPVVPGRVEVIHGNFFNVIVDYAYEPEEMKQLYQTISRWPYGRAIQVLGPTGGGRDRARIPVLGSMAGHFVDTMIITTDDPYDDNPEELAKYMLEGALSSGKVLNKDVFVELDRKQAILLALSKAQQNDLVLVTGKGADQKMALANDSYVDWDDRKAVKEALFDLQGF